MPLSWIIMVVACIAPFASYGYGFVQGKLETRSLIAKARVEEQESCKASIASIEQQINKAAESRVKEAMDASDKITDPVDRAELDRVCKQSASCRERKRQGG